MLYRLFPLTSLLFVSLALQAQIPQSIQLGKGGKPGSQVKMMACVDQFAGTISFSNFVGQSNDIDLDTIYFCYGDQIDIVHNNDDDLTGDPNPLTLPGITYGYFNCPPTISGPDLTTILTDPCIISNPPPINDLWITGGGQANGNITFSNTGNSQAIFNGGDPVLLWFAPITIDRFPNIYEPDPMTGEAGPCTNLNVDEAFAVVYLNEITTSGLNTNSGQSGCHGTFEVFGGLPEFDGSNYSFDITLVGNSSVQGTVISGTATHGSTVEFEVPVPGVYSISVEDGKSCGGFLLANMSSCVSVSQSIQSVSAAPGDIICIDVTNEGGFNDLVTMQYAMTWDESVLQFNNVTNLTPLLPSFTVPTSFNSLGDSLIFSWASLSGNGVDLPAGTVLYQICFTVVGSDGDCTDIYYTPAGLFIIEVVNEQGSSLGFNGIDGEVCVSSSALVVNFTQTGVTCPGGTNGSFTVTVNGGLAPYEVAWQNTGGGPIGGPGIINLDGGSFTANNLAAGTYSVTITDAQGTPLIATEQVVVPGPPSLNIVFDNTSPLCNGDDNGEVEASLISGGMPVSNPTASYTFAWNVGGGNVTTTSNLISANYSLTVTNNATGCTATGSTFLSQPTPLNVTVTLDSASCSGIGDGSLHVIVAGGTPDNNGDYVIQWPTIGAGLTVINTTSNVTGLASDSYQLIVTDANGCFVEQNIWLPAIKVLSANAVITDISCNNVCSGSIFLVASSTGGTPDALYNFDWFGVPVPPPTCAETNTTTTLCGLCVGTYTVVIENPDGCEIDTTFSIVAPNELIVSVANFQNETCLPGNDGSITVGVAGGTTPYTYTWDTPNGSGPTASGLSAGTYSVTVEDAGGCLDSLTTTIVAPTPPTITSLPDDVVSCPNSTDGSLTATATPGSAPIVTYNWSNGQAGQTISNLAPNTYIVTVFDANGCTATDTALVSAVAPLVLDSLVLTSPQCPGLGGGTIIAYVTGGTLPYFFNWSNGIAGPGFNVNGNLLAGPYSVTIQDASGCPPIIADTTLADPPSILATFSAIDSVSCANTGQTCDGTATATAMYSDGSSGVFDFIWVSGETDNNTTSSTAAQLCAGAQQLIVSDGICNDTFQVVIPAPLPITPGQSIENVSCNGLADGEITLIPSGGTPPYSIVWGNGTQGPTITGLAAGNYTAVITDSKNCNFTHTVTIIEPDPFEVALNNSQTNNVSCPGEADGTISVVVQGGNLGQLVYLWENGVAPPTASTATGLAPGTYSVTVVDPKGCEDSLSFSISEPPPIQFILGEITPIQCFGQNTFITVDSVWGGNPTANYAFSVNAGVNLQPGQQTAVVAGNQLIEIVDLFNGCTADTSITIDQPQEIGVELPAILVIELGDSLTMFDPVIISTLPIDTFIWDPATNLSCADCKNPRVTAIEDQLYTLTIIDINGCSASAQVLVEVDRNRNVYIPNVFSPNGDGINDKFQIFTGVGVTRINFIKIYDRWGERVFVQNDVLPSPDGTDGWDGVFRGQKMNPAVFLYLIEVEFIDGQVLLYRGDVTLVR